MESLELWQYLAIAMLFVWGGFVRSALGFGGSVLTLPFLLLAFKNAFYQKRFYQVFHLKV